MTAVPTIVSYTKPPKVRKSPKKRASTCTRPTCRTGHKDHLQDHRGYSAPPPEDSSTASCKDAFSYQLYLIGNQLTNVYILGYHVDEENLNISLPDFFGMQIKM